MNEEYEFDAVVIGAGVVGLATARELASRGQSVVVIEAERWIGSHTSSRNSEVIHAGIYYPAGSAKAVHCVRGKRMLYDYCSVRSVPFNQCGKLIVAATEDELGKLSTIVDKAAANGVEDLRPVSKAEIRSLEPELDVTGAVLSPSTGVLDSHAFMEALATDLEEAGGLLSLRTEAMALLRTPQGEKVTCRSADGGTFALKTKRLVNAAGLFAWNVAQTVTGDDGYVLPPRYFARGQYVRATGRAPFQRLIYPLPVEGGLGVHVTLELDGNWKFGPDIEWCEAIDYEPRDSRLPDFADAIARYFPGIRHRELRSDYVGVRPKLSGPGEPPSDFRLDLRSPGGSGGIMHLFGIESPGLTASLSLAKEVAEQLA